MSIPQLIPRKKIDEQLWNACVMQSPNSLPYALSWYLDSVAENWDGLVLNNYEAVMPLVWLRKFRVPCLYQPYYCQQLGVFGKDITSETLRLFLKEASQKFSYTHINLNPSFVEVAKEFGLKKKKNLLLNLNEEFAVIQKMFSENHRRNISKATKTGFVFTEIELRAFQKFYLDNINREQQNFKPQHEKIFRQLTQTVAKQKIGTFFAVASREGTVIAASLIVFHQDRIINIINVSSEAGKKNGASHFLFNSIIQKFSAQKLILDFEGSSIPSVARFYEGFGAEEEIFYMYETHFFKTISQRFS